MKKELKIKLKKVKLEKKKENKPEKISEEENIFEDKNKFSGNSVIDIPTTTLPVSKKSLPQPPENLENITANSPNLPASTPQKTNIYDGVVNAPLYSSGSLSKEGRQITEELRRAGNFTDAIKKTQIREPDRVFFQDPTTSWIQKNSQQDYIPQKLEFERERFSSPTDFQGPKKRQLDERKYESV